MATGHSKDVGGVRAGKCGSSVGGQGRLRHAGIV